MKIHPHNRYASFKFAFAGLKRLVKEYNFRIHIIIATLTAFAGILCGISLIEWCCIIICFGLVLAAEGFNTAIEILADRICSCKDESIKLAKDVSAAAVLLTTFSSAVVGLLIFAHRLLHIIHLLLTR